jgi:hypothetical protein
MVTSETKRLFFTRVDHIHCSHQVPRMNMEEPPSDDLLEGEKQNGADEDDSRSQGSIMDGNNFYLLELTFEQ